MLLSHQVLSSLGMYWWQEGTQIRGLLVSLVDRFCRILECIPTVFVVERSARPAIFSFECIRFDDGRCPDCAAESLADPSEL